MHAEIESRKDLIAGICGRYRVTRLELFGSAARGTDFDPQTSDVDFLVEFEPPLLPDLFDRRAGMQEDLREVLGRDVDLIRTGTIRNRYRMATIGKRSMQADALALFEDVVRACDFCGRPRIRSRSRCE